MSCHGCFPECSVGLTPVSALERRSPRQVAPRSPGHCRASRYISGGARPILPEASRGRPRSLGTGGREGSRLLRAGGAVSWPRRGVGHGGGGSALLAARCASRGSRAQPDVVALNPPVSFCACSGIFISKEVSSQLSRRYFNIAYLRVLALVLLPPTHRRAGAVLLPAAPHRRRAAALRSSLPLGPGSVAHGKSHRCHLSCLRWIHARA